MTDATDPRLDRLLGGAELAAVRARMRQWFERQQHGAIPAAFRLDRLGPAEYLALCQLIGRPAGAGTSIRIEVDRLDAALREAGIAASLRDALERLDGPIGNRAALKRDLQVRWSSLAEPGRWTALLEAWLASSTAVTLLKRLGRDPERAARLLSVADMVLRRLPAAGVPRSQLAADTLGDAHALDAGRPVATLILAAWRHNEGGGPATGEIRDVDPELDESRPADERVRDVWARAGVLVNELARPVLFLNLPLPQCNGAAWRPGEPGYLSLRQLLRAAPTWEVADVTVFVCENPNVVAIAADRLGADCAPLVCTDGMPAAAQRALLTQLSQAGARLRYHGDFDWPGIRIGNYVMRCWHAMPWRFAAGDYQDAVAQTPARSPDLDKSWADAAWDASLTGSMREHGLAVAEEAVVGRLLEDLQQNDLGGSSVSSQRT